jgi:UDP:flavonoid glycosyltransferase YjiC (YdhE family)
MALILFVAELGSGFGHVRRLLPVAKAAAAQGHRPLFITANNDEIAPLVAEAGFESRPAPKVRVQPPVASGKTAVATSFADILGGLGFGDLASLRRCTNAWDALLAECRPAAVVCEFSPFLCLAALGSDLPVLVLGYGFILPPPELPRFPHLWQGTPAYSEARLLETVAELCRERSRPVLESLPRLFAGTAHAVTGLQVLDPYQDLRRQPAVGPPALEVQIETEATDDLFAYLLGDAAPTSQVLEVLSRSRCRGSAYVRRGIESHRRMLDSGRVTWLERPTPIRDALSRARLVVHHGSMLFAEEALAAGRPQVIVPLYLEHLFTARALARLGVARIARPSAGPGELEAALAAALADGTMTARALVVAEAFWRTTAPPTDLPLRLLRNVVAG